MSGTANDLVGALQIMSETALSEINTVMPGVIVSVSGDGRRAVVRPTLPKMLASGEPLDPPNVVEVPIVWPRVQGGAAGMTLPIRPGDGVMLCFAQRSMEGWLSGQNVAPDDPRRFDLSDAIAVPGLLAGGVGVDRDEVQMFFGQTKLRLKEDGTAIVETRGGSLTIKPDGEADFVGPKVQISGDLVVRGNINAGGDVAAGTISLRNHRHLNSGGAGLGGTPAP